MNSPTKGAESLDPIDQLTSPLRLQDKGDSANNSQIQWLEAFFDVVFSVAITQLATILGRHATFIDVLAFTALLLPFWWIWMGNVVFGLRFGSDNLLYRFSTFSQILAVAAMIALTPSVGRQSSLGFAVAYIIARLVLLMLYGIAWRTIATARTVTRVYLIGFSTGVSFWIISLLLPIPLRFVFWGIGIAIDFLTPWVGRPILQSLPIDASRLPERLGIFTTIVLSQSILSVITGVTQVHWQITSSVVAIFIFFITVAFWWSYFSYYQIAHPTARLGSGQPYIYTHLPFIVGIAIVGAATQQIILQAGQLVLATNILWLFIGGTLLWVVGFWLIQMVSLPRQFSPAITLVSLGAIIAYGIDAVIGLHAVPLIMIAFALLVFVIIILVKLWLFYRITATTSTENAHATLRQP